MSDIEETTTAETVEQEQAGPAVEGEPKVFDAEYVAKLRQEAAKYRTEAKANAEAAKRLAEIEEANKTEAQKLADRLKALEAENAAFKQEKQVAAWAAEVSEETGVPAGVLRGSSKEELLAHAESLKSLLPSERTPVSQPVPGVSQAPHGKPGNIPLKDQIAAAEAAGDHETAKSLKAVMLGQAFQSTN